MEKEKNRDYWSTDGQIFLCDGKGYVLAENLNTVCPGNENDILNYPFYSLESLRLTQNVPSSPC